jgi:hypothetical protein
MLYLYREILQSANPIYKTVYNQTDREMFEKKALKGIYAAYEQIHVYEITRFKNIFNNDKDQLLSKDISLNRISLNAEIDEITLLSLEIELMDANPPADIYDRINRHVNPYSLITNMYNRYLKLRLKAIANEKQFCEFLGCELNIEVRNPDAIQSYLILSRTDKLERLKDLEFFITDTIFCYFEIIKILNTFDNSFSLNHTLQMEAHLKLYIWSVYYNAYLRLYDLKHHPEMATESEQDAIDLVRLPGFIPENLVEKLGKLIEPDNLPFISHLFQGEKTMREYYAAKETHSEGKAYKSFIEKMYYLNDDYNDRLFHFSIALERFKLKTQTVMQMESRMKRNSENSDAYKIISYENTIV